MVHAFGTPKRHPESGVFLFRKRVPAHLTAILGKSEIKFSLRTRDPVVARIRNLEETARIERAWSKIDGAVVEALGRGPAAAMQATAAEPTATEIPVTDTFAAETAAMETTTMVAKEVATTAAPVAKPLRPIFESYAKEAELSPATVKRWSPVVDRLVGHLGHDDASRILRDDVVAWKDALLPAA
jgi:hypothetical protein